MQLDNKILGKAITILTVFIFIGLAVRIGITIWENHILVNEFAPNPNPNEPYLQRNPIAEEDFIDYYIYQLYSPFATAPIGRPSNTFELKRSINYYSAPDDSLEPVITLEAGKKYIIAPNDISLYKYGIQSWPTYKRGWRFAIPFIEEGDEKSIASAYYVKLKDLFDPLKSIIEEQHYQVPKGYRHRRILLAKDEMLYKEGYYLSPDLHRSVIDGWNIALLITGLCLITVRAVLIKRRLHAQDCDKKLICLLRDSCK